MNYHNRLLITTIFTCFFLTGCTAVGQNNAPSENKVSQDTVSDQVTALSENTVSNESAVSAPLSDNLLKNGDFETGKTTNWSIFTQGGRASLESVNNALAIQIDHEGIVEHGVQLYQEGFSLDSGCVYRMSFDIASDVPCTIEYRIQINSGDYHPYSAQKIDLTPQMQTVTIDFTMTESSDPAPRLAFNMGVMDDKSPVGAHLVTLDNVALYLMDDSKKIVAEPAPKAPDIIVDQIGYETDSKKIAMLRSETSVSIDTAYDIMDAASGKVVYSGNTTGSMENKNSLETTAYADFSDFNIPGTYKLSSPDFSESYPFTIGEDIYGNALPGIIKMLYMQRCGTELPATYATDFSHKACHTGKALVYGTDDTYLDVSGGWHDAGDYGRYVVPGAKAVMDILLAYEYHPEAFDDNSGIPESKNTIPDILDEAKYEIDWMLKMQTDDGGVYHKVTCANFPTDVMPEEETDQLILSPVSTTATGDFAAVMAKFSVIYRPFDMEFSDICLNASKKAYEYLSKTPVTKDGFKNPDGILTGEYPDIKDRDERYWAATELYNATGEKQYHQGIMDALIVTPPSGFGWADVGSYGSLAYLTCPYDTDKAFAASVRKLFYDKADDILATSSTDGYLISLDSYPWGSNMVVASNAMLLMITNELRKDSNESPLENSTQAVEDHVHYVFGRNPVAYSFVTGTGTTSPQHVHHRVCTATGKVVPGMLVGGPDMNLEDPYARMVLKDLAPAKRYSDNVQSYSTNEVTIYWNSPLIFVLSGLE